MSENLVNVGDFRQFGMQKKHLLDPPHIVFLLHEHDKIVNDFCDKIFPHVADANGFMDKKQALSYLAIYANGIEIRKAHEHFKKIKFNEAEMKELIEILNKPIPELKEYGMPFIQMAQMKFNLYARKWWNTERYKKIFKSDSFFKWIKKIQEYPNLDNGMALLEFNNFKNIDLKVQDLLNTQIQV